VPDRAKGVRTPAMLATRLGGEPDIAGNLPVVTPGCHH
jgi:hypothetical protein